MKKVVDKNVYKVYDKVATWFADNRDTALLELPYLQQFISLLPEPSTVLDLGCGTGVPIFKFLVENNIEVTGLDASKAMLNLACQQFPNNEFILQDMRTPIMGHKFDGLIAWHSLFHLPGADQIALFPLFSSYLNDGGVLMFTSGDKLGEAWGNIGGEELYHASLDPDTYLKLLTDNHFKVISYTPNHEQCGGATVWLAQFVKP